MKKLNLFKAAFVSASLAFLLMIAGCTSGSDTVVIAGDIPVPTANVVVQLTNGGSNYLVDQMTVFIIKLDDPGMGTILTGTTGTDGIATIPVTETGVYEVFQVAGVDATNLAQDSTTGREFVKSNPIVDPYPNLTYAFSDIEVNVATLGSDYTVNAEVPLINRVTVLRVGTATYETDGQVVSAGTGAFAGRIMLSNFNSDGNRARISILSSDTEYYNRIGLAIDSGGNPFHGVFISDSNYNVDPITSYTQAGPIYFEAPGTDNGDWALGYNLTTTDLHSRGELGGENYDRNFPYFNGGDGGDGYSVFLWTFFGSTYSYDYRIFQFDLIGGPK